MQIEEGRTAGGVSYTVRCLGSPLLWMSGSGMSRTRMLPTTTGTMAGDAVSVLDRLGLDPAHVVGPSLGGMVAQELAIGWLHRVLSLVLCSTTAGDRARRRRLSGTS